MQPNMLQLMHDQVRAIYRTVTGGDLPDRGQPEPGAAGPSLEAIHRNFAQLESIVHQIPMLAERVAPLSFTPPLDASGTERELIIEVGVPGIEREDVSVEVAGENLVIAGARAVERAQDGRSFFHAEIPRGPFRRVVPLPFPTVGEPRVEVERGLIRVRLARHTRAAAAKA